jgi:hypothetical protein
MSMFKARSAAVMATALLVAAAPAMAQITTGSVTGTVTDAQGGVVPGATVVLVSETQGTRMSPAVTNSEGSYTVPGVKADTYTVEVTMPSFKPLSRKGVKVSGGDRVAVETLVLQIGQQTESVVVQAEAPVIQAASGERSGVIQTTQLANLPSGTGHNFTEFLALVPGVSGTAKIGGSGQSNFMIDGISAMDTGNNGLMGGLSLPVDQVAEVKVITSGYQAEYGRSIGLQVSAVTKGGTNRFHGSFYDYERHSDWNSNSWVNIKNGNPKAVNDQRDWGYSIGGPVGKPGGNNKLFFFYTSEYRPRTTGNTVNNFRLPTEAERRGDYSQSLDSNGAVFNLIYDPNNAAGLPKSSCAGSVTTACFQDGGVLGKIPVNRLYGPGIALLNQYPIPNVTQAPGSAFNWTNLSPVQNTLTFSPTYRIDYQVSSNLRATGKWSGTSARVQPAIGTIPSFNDTLQKFPLSFNSSGTVNYTWTQTMFLEVTYGMNQNRLGTPNINDASNRNNVLCPPNLAAVVANCSLGGIAFPFTGDIPVNTSYYEYKALQEIGVPFLVNSTFQMPPVFSWAATGTTGKICANVTGCNTPPNQSFPGFMNINRTQDFSVSLTKVRTTHSYKAGFYINHSYKAQNFGAGGNGAPSFQGALNFGNDTNNPLDSGFPYANAALGIFSSYGQQSAFIEGSFLYNNVEWYVQDNWKAKRRLTLDYGVRFVHQTPQYDQFNQVSTFRPETWSLASAPYLYVPGCLGGTATCSGNNRVAMDPRTGQLLAAGSSSLVGNVILGSGNGANGLTQAGHGIANTGYLWPGLAITPRVGAAYDFNGRQKVVFRGSVGLFIDRPDGNSVFSTVGNPPVATSTQSQWGFVQTLQSTQFRFGPVPIVNSFEYDAKLPKDVQWNGGVQIALPWASALDFEYVGHHAYDILSASGGASSTNINTIDLGTFLPGGVGIDPTSTTGATLSNNLVRAYRGYGNINLNLGRYYRTYHSVQASFNRRFSHGVSFGVNWNWAIHDFSNAVGLRINHNPDGTYVVRSDNAQAVSMFGDRGDVKHIVKGNFVWQLPTLHADSTTMRAVGYVVNDWQLSGIFTIDSGAPYDVTYSYQSGGGTNLTGSPDYTARIVIPNLSTIGGGCSSDQFSQFNNKVAAASGGVSPVTSVAFSGPQPGSLALESGQNLFTGCGNKNLDVAIQRNIKLGGSRQLQLRADVFNVFNTVVYNARNTTIQFNSPTDLTVRNSQYLADGSIDPARVKPNQAGFGAVTGAAGLRTVQGQIRFTF